VFGIKKVGKKVPIFDDTGNIITGVFIWYNLRISENLIKITINYFYA